MIPFVKMDLNITILTKTGGDVRTGTNNTIIAKINNDCETCYVQIYKH